MGHQIKVPPAQVKSTAESKYFSMVKYLQQTLTVVVYILVCLHTTDVVGIVHYY